MSRILTSSQVRGLGVEDRQVFLGKEHQTHQQDHAQQEVGPQDQGDALAPVLVVELPQPGKDESRKEKCLEPWPHASSYPKGSPPVKAAGAAGLVLSAGLPAGGGSTCLIDSLPGWDVIL